MPQIGVITDAYIPGVVLPDLPDTPEFYAPSSGRIPSADELAEFETLVVIGVLANAGVAVQLSGVIRLALEMSQATMVFGYPVHIAGADERFVRELGLPVPYGNSPNAVFGFPQEFHEYFTEYGQSGSAFYNTDAEGARVIGWIHENEGPEAPTALCWESERRGVIYVVPYFISRAGSPGRMLATLVGAVVAHRDGLAVGLPGYLSEVRLGAAEQMLLTQIEEIEEAVAEKRAIARDFERWRHLIGRASGASFVELVTDSLNLLLDGAGYHATTRPDVGAEDFWIVGSDGDFALGEAKGVGGGVTRAMVSQVDSHREARNLPPEFPGLLIVNAYRGDSDLARKRDQPIAPNVTDLARTQNVVVLRSWDLYQLVGQKSDGEDVELHLLRALQDPQGGWLRVNASTIEISR